MSATQAGDDDGFASFFKEHKRVEDLLDESKHLNTASSSIHHRLLELCPLTASNVMLHQPCHWAFSQADSKHPMPTQPTMHSKKSAQLYKLEANSTHHYPLVSDRVAHALMHP